MFKKFLIGIVVLSFSFSLVGQNIEGVNARIDAMAGSGATTDIGWSIHNPANLYQFPNQVQGTAVLMDIPSIGITYGSIIGILRLNDYLYTGFTLNNRMSMPGHFYEHAAWTLGPDQEINGDNNAQKFPNIPQVNFCVKVNDNLKIGLGGFFESSSYSKTNLRKYGYTLRDTLEDGSDTDTLLYKTSMDGYRVRVFGFDFETRITAGPVTIFPQLRMGFPRLEGKIYDNQIEDVASGFKKNEAESGVDLETYNDEYETPEGLLLNVGTHVFSEIGSSVLCVGAFYSNKHYQFNVKKDTLSATVESDGIITDDTTLTGNHLDNDINVKSIDYWLALIPSFSDNLYFSPEYNGGMEFYYGKNPMTAPDTMITRVYHTFRLGIEREIKDVWIFDAIVPRFGISAQWRKEWRKIVDYNPEIEEQQESLTWKSVFWGSDFTNKEAKINCGFGLVIGRGTLDVSCNLLGWKSTGILSGPTAAMATITTDFSKNFKHRPRKRGASSTTSVSSYDEPAPAPVETFTPEDSDNTIDEGESGSSDEDLGDIEF